MARVGPEGAEGQGREKGDAIHGLGGGAVKGNATQGRGGVGAGGVWPDFEMNSL